MPVVGVLTCSQQQHDLCLEWVGVLELVHEDGVKSRPQRAARGLVPYQQVARFEQEIVVAEHAVAASRGRVLKDELAQGERQLSQRVVADLSQECVTSIA